MDDDKIDAALDLLRRLPPNKISDNINLILDATGNDGDLNEELLSSVDQPLGVKTCPVTQKLYLTCDFNRYIDSFRSPWSNEFDPPSKDGPKPSSSLREIEELMNQAFKIYTSLYFEGDGLSSVYLWDIGTHSWAGAVLLKKTSNSNNQEMGTWDSIHVFQAENTSRTTTYKLTSTIMLSIDVAGKPNVPKVSLCGNLTRQSETSLPAEDNVSHVSNVGSIIEQMENSIRNQIYDVYFKRTKNIIASIRSYDDLQKQSKVFNLQKALVGDFQKSDQCSKDDYERFESSSTS